jgi:hypothetical protein
MMATNRKKACTEVKKLESTYVIKEENIGNGDSHCTQEHYHIICTSLLQPWLPYIVFHYI